MGVLREKMIEEMKLRNFPLRTQKSYVAAMVGPAKHYRRFPAQLTQDRSAPICCISQQLHLPALCHY